MLQYTGMGASETRQIPHSWLNQTDFQRLGNMSANPVWRYVSDGMPIASICFDI
jgi:hypothetical protein